MNWQHRTIITPMALAEPARAACIEGAGAGGRVELGTGLPVDF